MPEFKVVARAADIPESAVIAVEIEGISLIVCRSNGELFAAENRCPHQNSPLAEGRVRRGAILCPLHGMGFDLKTGRPKGNLTQSCLRMFAVREVNDAVEVEVPTTSSGSQP